MATGDGARGPRKDDTEMVTGDARRAEAAEGATQDVARHVSAVGAAGDAERARLRALFAALPVGVVLVDARAADLPIVFANAAFSALTGYPIPAALGRNCRFLQGPDTDPVAVATLRRALAAGTGCTVTLRNYRHDGTPFWNELTLAPLRGVAGRIVAHVGVQVDVTARVEADRQQALQAAVLDATAEGIYGLDHAGRCTFINPAAATLLGYTAAEVLGRDMHALVHHHHRDGTPYPSDACPIHQATAGGQGVRVADEVIWRRDGTAVPVAYAVQPMAGAGFAGAVVTLVDVRERERAEQERAALLVRERTARAEAEAAVAQRDHLLSLAAHDLRTPLAALIGEVQLRQRRLQRGRPLSAEEQGPFLATLHDLLHRQVAVVSEVTDAAYVRMGEQLALRVEAVDLGALAHEVADLLAHAHGAGAAAIDVAVPTGVVIVGDRDRLVRVLQNIIGNAVKYSPADAPVQVSVRAEEGGAVVVVRDAGVGIPTSEIDRVFTPFYRASTARGFAGTGLGLAGARAIVAQHGGTIALESAPGVGTTVTITLPGAEGAARGS